MTRLIIKPTDRVRMSVWRIFPTAVDHPGWRVARTVNGIPTDRPEKFSTWREALDFALTYDPRR